MPLAVEQASALLKTTFTLSDFLSSYRSHYAIIMERYPPQGLLAYDKGRSIIVVFDMLYQSLERSSPAAAALLTFMSLFGQWSIPTSFLDKFQSLAAKFRDTSTDGSDRLVQALQDPVIIRLCLDDLSKLCLVKVSRNRALACQNISVHGAISDWCVRVLAPMKHDWMIQSAGMLAREILVPDKG
jgi:hypothetical protein